MRKSPSAAMSSAVAASRVVLRARPAAAGKYVAPARGVEPHQAAVRLLPRCRRSGRRPELKDDPMLLQSPGRLAALVVAAGLLLTACGTGTDTAGTPPVGDGPSPVEAPAEGDQPWLTDGHYLGYLRHLDTEAGIIRLDLVTWVNDEEEPNGFRIDDPDDTLWEGRLAMDATAAVIDCRQACEPVAVDLADIARRSVRPLNGEDALFDVVVAEQVVRSVDERYTP
jgi:hypothetical protein